MRRKRGLLSMAKDKPRRVFQTLAVDDFGELATRKREALAQARQHGHQMAGWHRRPNDPYGRWQTYCVDCRRMAVVATEKPDWMDTEVYGPALTTECLKEAL